MWQKGLLNGNFELTVFELTVSDLYLIELRYFIDFCQMQKSCPLTTKSMKIIQTASLGVVREKFVLIGVNSSAYNLNMNTSEFILSVAHQKTDLIER